VAEAIEEGVARVNEVLEKAPRQKGHETQARFLCDQGGEALSGLRAACDRAEEAVGRDAWPLPKYRDLLFLV